MLGDAATPSKVCRLCGDSFWTQVGLDEHVRVGQHNRMRRRWVTGSVSPAALVVLQQRGREIAAENNARRRRCGGCDLTSTPSGLGLHQKATGHTGWAES
jgi:hypothetical protein